MALLVNSYSISIFLRIFFDVLFIYVLFALWRWHWFQYFYYIFYHIFSYYFFYTYSTKFIHFKNDTDIWLNLFFFYLIHWLKILTEFVLFYLTKKNTKIVNESWQEKIKIRKCLRFLWFYNVFIFYQILMKSSMFHCPYCININIMQQK